MTLRDQLLAKRANYLSTVAQCEVQVLKAGAALKQAKKTLRAMQQAQAQARGGLQVLEETIAALDKPEPPSTAP